MSRLGEAVCIIPSTPGPALPPWWETVLTAVLAIQSTVSTQRDGPEGPPSASGLLDGRVRRSGPPSPQYIELRQYPVTSPGHAGPFMELFFFHAMGLA